MQAIPFGLQVPNKVGHLLDQVKFDQNLYIKKISRGEVNVKTKTVRAGRKERPSDILGTHFNSSVDRSHNWLDRAIETSLMIPWHTPENRYKYVFKSS